MSHSLLFNVLSFCLLAVSISLPATSGSTSLCLNTTCLSTASDYSSSSSTALQESTSSISTHITDSRSFSLTQSTTYGSGISTQTQMTSSDGKSSVSIRTVASESEPATSLQTSIGSSISFSLLQITSSSMLDFARTMTSDSRSFDVTQIPMNDNGPFTPTRLTSLGAASTKLSESNAFIPTQAKYFDEPSAVTLPTPSGSGPSNSTQQIIPDSPVSDSTRAASLDSKPANVAQATYADGEISNSTQTKFSIGSSPNSTLSILSDEALSNSTEAALSTSKLTNYTQSSFPNDPTSNSTQSLPLNSTFSDSPQTLASNGLLSKDTTLSAMNDTYPKSIPAGIPNGTMSDGTLYNSTLNNNTTKTFALTHDTLLNGTLLNGTLLNGTLLNGTLLNGTLFNGTLLNGTLLNGTLLNGTLLNGTLLNYTLNDNASFDSLNGTLSNFTQSLSLNGTLWNSTFWNSTDLTPAINFPYMIPFNTNQSCNIYGPLCQPGSITASFVGRDSRTTSTAMPCSSYLSLQSDFFRENQGAEQQQWEIDFWRSPQCRSFAAMQSNGAATSPWTFSECKGAAASVTVDLTSPGSLPSQVPAALAPPNKQPCCGYCYMWVPELRLYYFADQNAEAYCSSVNRTMVGGDPENRWPKRAAAPTPVINAASTVVVSGHTLTSPSMYIELIGAPFVTDDCGTVGAPVTNPFVAVPSGGLLSEEPFHFSVGEVAVGHWAGLQLSEAVTKAWTSGDPEYLYAPFNTKSLNIAELECPTIGVGMTESTYWSDGRVQTEIYTTIGPPWLPYIIPPLSVLSKLHPLWDSQCGGRFADGILGVFDPPRALMASPNMIAPDGTINEAPNTTPVTVMEDKSPIAQPGPKSPASGPMQTPVAAPAITPPNGTDEQQYPDSKDHPAGGQSISDNNPALDNGSPTDNDTTSQDDQVEGKEGQHPGESPQISDPAQNVNAANSVGSDSSANIANTGASGSDANLPGLTGHESNANTANGGTSESDMNTPDENDPGKSKSSDPMESESDPVDPTSDESGTNNASTDPPAANSNTGDIAKSETNSNTVNANVPASNGNPRKSENAESNGNTENGGIPQANDNSANAGGTTSNIDTGVLDSTGKVSVPDGRNQNGNAANVDSNGNFVDPSVSGSHSNPGAIPRPASDRVAPDPAAASQSEQMPQVKDIENDGDGADSMQLETDTSNVQAERPQADTSGKNQGTIPYAAGSGVNQESNFNPPDSSSNETPSESPSIITIGDQVITPAASGFSIGAGTTVRPGGPAATVANSLVSLDPSGVLLINGRPTSFSEPTVSDDNVDNSNNWNFASPLLAASPVTIGNQVITPAAAGFSVGAGTVVTPGGPAATIANTFISLDPSGVLYINGQPTNLPRPSSPSQVHGIDDFDDLDFSPTHSSPSPITIGDQVITPAASGFIVGSGTTVMPGGPPVTVANTPISLDTSGVLFINGQPEVTLQPSLTSHRTNSYNDDVHEDGIPSSPSAITIGGHTFISTLSGLAIDDGNQEDGHMLVRPGGAAVTIDDTAISLDTSGVLYINGQSATSLDIPQATPLLQYMQAPTDPSRPIIIGDEIITPAATGFVIGAGTTVLPGGPTVTVGNTAISLDPSGVLFINGRPTRNLSPTSPSPIIIDGQIITPAATGIVVGAGRTVLPGGPAMTVGNTAISLDRSGVLYINGHPTQTLNPVPPSLITIDGQIITPAASGFAIRPGMTVKPGGPAITIDHSTISLDPSGVLIINGRRTTLSRNFPSIMYGDTDDGPLTGTATYAHSFTQGGTFRTKNTRLNPGATRTAMFALGTHLPDGIGAKVATGTATAAAGSATIRMTVKHSSAAGGNVPLIKPLAITAILVSTFFLHFTRSFLW